MSSYPTSPSQGAPDGSKKGLLENLGQAGWRTLLWVPSLYLAMGIPYNVINGTALRMYKSLGIPDSEITLALGSVGIAWSLKPLWAAFLDMYKTKKFFVLAMEALLGVLFMAVAMALPMPDFFKISIALFWVAAFASSTQDICADGVYLTALDETNQARFAGIQGTFWVTGKVLAAGVSISVLDRVSRAQGWAPGKMWMIIMITSGAVMLALAAYHLVVLPTGSISKRPESAATVVSDFLATGKTFFHKRAFWGMIAFVFLYRLGEGLILMEGQLFLQSDVAKGGLGLTAGQVSDIDAIYGTIASIIGGLLGGAFVSKLKLPKALGYLGLALNIPHLTFIVLSQLAVGQHGVDYVTTVSLVSIEKFGYGFGFVGNMIYMMQQLAPGRSTMTHYAYATSLMNLMLVPTAMISGPLAHALGFSSFFLVVILASIPSAWAAFKAPFPILESETKREGDPQNSIMITVDDPSRLTPAQINIQHTAGRSAMFAMLMTLSFLVIDAFLLGKLQTTEGGPAPSPVFFWLLVGNVALKLYLAAQSWTASTAALEEAKRHQDSTYSSNATGSRIVVILCFLVTPVVLYLGLKGVGMV
jgi:MFS transporter, PAT family, beta-lactamase induction signal transducer AmpG